MGLYADTIPQYRKMLGNLDRWLIEARETAEAAGYDPANLLIARLAPDQLDLTRNIQAACDSFKLAGARMAGVDAPVHEDGPASLDELQARINEVREFLDGLSAEDIDASSDRILVLSMLGGRGARVDEYIRAFATPNAYFHLCMAYAILRHNGVKLGKRTYIAASTRSTRRTRPRQTGTQRDRAR